MSDDKHLMQAVIDELNWEPSVNSANIGVTAKDGVVTLMGHVGSYSEKYAAEKAVRRVKSVKAIAEEIEVKLPLGVERSDEEIAAAAIGRLKWDAAVPSDAVKVKVEKGRVTLTGQVDWHYQQQAAADDIRSLWGVTGVSNQIAIKPKADASNIKENILIALHRSWFDPSTIKVAVDGGKVKLSGSVDDWNEWSLAASAAWAAPGTTSVENRIRVH